MPSPLFIIVDDTPEIASKAFETVFSVAPDGIVIARVVLLEFKPKFAPVWPTVTDPSPTDESGTILVTVLKTLLPEEVLPSVGPVIVSVIVLPATSVPVTVKPVDDKSPPSEVIDIVPCKAEWENGVPKDVPEQQILWIKRV